MLIELQEQTAEVCQRLEVGQGPGVMRVNWGRHCVTVWPPRFRASWRLKIQNPLFWMLGVTVPRIHKSWCITHQVLSSTPSQWPRDGIARKRPWRERWRPAPARNAVHCCRKWARPSSESARASCSCVGCWQVTCATPRGVAFFYLVIIKSMTHIHTPSGMSFH